MPIPKGDTISAEPAQHGFNTPPDYTDKRGVAAMLSVSTRTVAEMLARGELPHVRLSKRCIRFPRQAILDAMAARTIGIK